MENHFGTSREKGNFGEDVASDYLLSNGYEIRKRNFHFGKTGEIDIIAEQNGELVFVEVKFRTSNTYGEPIDSITPKKVMTLRKVAEGYLYVNKIYNKPCRFDVIIVDFRTKPPKIEHLKSVV